MAPATQFARPPLRLLGSPSSIPTIDHYGYDADAQRYIEAVEAADGQRLELQARTAINDFVVGCKSDAIWDAFRCCVVLSGARTLSGALTPLVGPTPTNVNFVSADYNRRTGLIGNGTTKYINTNLAASTIPRDNEHCSVYKGTGFTNSDTSICIGNSLNAVGTTHVRVAVGFISQANSRITTTASVPSHITSGFIGIARRDRRTVQWQHQSGYGEESNYLSNGVVNANWVVYQGWNGTTPWALVNFRQAFYSVGTYCNIQLLGNRVRAMYDAFQSLPI